jgi:hypothetical protein
MGWMWWPKTAKTKMDVEEMEPMVIVVGGKIKRDHNKMGRRRWLYLRGKVEVVGEFFAE